MNETLTNIFILSEFYNYFSVNPNATYISFIGTLINKTDLTTDKLKHIVDNLRRNLQKMNIMKSSKHFLGKGNITTVKKFDEEKYNNYVKYVQKHLKYL